MVKVVSIALLCLLLFDLTLSNVSIEPAESWQSPLSFTVDSTLLISENKNIFFVIINFITKEVDSTWVQYYEWMDENIAQARIFDMCCRYNETHSTFSVIHFYDIHGRLAKQLYIVYYENNKTIEAFTNLAQFFENESRNGTEFGDNCFILSDTLDDEESCKENLHEVDFENRMTQDREIINNINVNFSLPEEFAELSSQIKIIVRYHGDFFVIFKNLTCCICDQYGICPQNKHDCSNITQIENNQGRNRRTSQGDKLLRESSVFPTNEIKHNESPDKEMWHMFAYIFLVTVIIVLLIVLIWIWNNNKKKGSYGGNFKKKKESEVGLVNSKLLNEEKVYNMGE